MEIIHKHNTTWISHEMVTKLTKLPDSYLRKRRTMAKETSSWRWTKINNAYYYDYETIPNRAPNFYRSQLPSAEELKKQANPRPKPIKELAKEDIQSRIANYRSNRCYQYYMYESGAKITTDVALKYSERKAIFDLLTDDVNGKRYQRFHLTQKQYFELAAEITAEYGISSPRTLRKELHYYSQSADKLAHIVSKKYNNSNSRIVGIHKVADIETGELFELDVHMSVAFHLWINPGKANKLHKIDVYQQYCKEISSYGFSPISESALNYYLRKFEAPLSLERDGEEHFTDKHLPVIHSARPQFVGTLWAADFSGSKLMYRTQLQKWDKDKKRRNLKWVAKSWYLFRIVDAASGYIVGWAVNDGGEDWTIVKQGMRMAVEANGGMTAKEIVTDNGPAFNKKAEGGKMLSILFDKHRTVGKNRKRANIAETYVRLLNQQARYFDEFVGKTSFAATHADNIANPDYIDIHKLPNKEEALDHIIQLINNWNTTPRADGASPESIFFNAEKHPALQPLDEITYRRCLGMHTQQELARQTGSVVIHKGKYPNISKHYYRVPNWAENQQKIANAVGQANRLYVDMYYDESGCDIYTRDGAYILTAVPDKRSHMSEFEATEESTAALSSGMREQEKFKDGANRLRDEILAAKTSLDVAEEGGFVVEELTYSQRAVLNGGKAKDEHNKLHQEKSLHQDDEDFISIDVTQQY
jgi:hypothetical protein